MPHPPEYITQLADHAMHILASLEHAGNKGVYRTSLIDGEFSLNDNYFILNLLKERSLVESQGELYLLEPDQFDLSERQKNKLRSEIEAALFLEFGTAKENTLTSFDFSEREKPTKGRIKRVHLLAYPITIVLGSLFFSNQIIDGNEDWGWDVPADNDKYIEDFKFKIDSLRATRPTEGDTLTFDLR